MNCRTCNIAAPQYELFDGLCGKCLLRITRDLLAVIHRDGGQYTEQHGLEVSVKSAGEISIGRLVTAEELQEQAAAMREALECWLVGAPSAYSFPREASEFISQCQARMRAALAHTDAGRDYVSKESVRPIVEALRPFVSEFKRKMAHSGRNSAYRKQWNERMPDHFPIQIKVTMGDCRAAVRALGLLEDK